MTPQEEVHFQKFVKDYLGDIPLKDQGKYINPKIRTYAKFYEAGTEFARSAQEPIEWSVSTLNTQRHTNVAKDTTNVS